MRAAARRNESGAAVTEVVIVTPLLLLMLMLVVQFALWEHASHVVRAAALEGVSAARLEGGTADAGKQRAQSMVQQLGSHVVVAPDVVVTKSATQVAVTVSGSTESVVPGMILPVKASVTAPVEALR